MVIVFCSGIALILVIPLICYGVVRHGLSRRGTMFRRVGQKLRLDGPGSEIVRGPPSPPACAGVCTRCLNGRCKGVMVHIFENTAEYVAQGQSPYTMTAVLVHTESLDLPEFICEPRSVAVRMREQVESNRGIFFPKDERFTMAYFVDGEDRDAIREMMGIAARDVVMAHEGLTLEGRGQWVMVYRSERLLGEVGILGAVDCACQLARLFQSDSSSKATPR